MTKSKEVILFQNTTPEGYAAKIWKSLGRNAIFTPLDGLVAEEDIEKVWPQYAFEVEKIASEWVASGGIINPYVMLWVVASKAY